MPLDSVLVAISEKGREEVRQIERDTGKEAEGILAHARAEGDELLKAAESDAHKVAARKRTQELARAELEARRMALTAQREILDDVYRRGLEKLRALSGREEIIRRLLEENRSEWQSGGHVYASPMDESSVKSIVGKSYAGPIDAVGGIVVENADGTHRIDLRFESTLRSVWNDVVREVAEVLWPSRVQRA